MESKQRKPYCKPEIKQVRLVPGEAVLGGCKMGSTSYPTSLSQSGGYAGCSLNGCNQDGTS